MSSELDYLVLGSGLSGLSFSALMAKRGHSIQVLEAHEFFGGYGHTFQVGDYRINAQLHYVIGCGEGETVDLFLKKLELEKKVTFRKLNPEGYDRVYCEGKALWIPYGLDNLEINMIKICPNAKNEIIKFIGVLKDFRVALDNLPKKWTFSPQLLAAAPSFIKMFKYRNATLQQVFDDCKLPRILQTLVSGQLLDYMLPPKKLSFFIWAALFTGYCKGAYYPNKHFEHVIDNIVESIKSHGGQLTPNERVVEFIFEGDAIRGVYTQTVDPQTGVFEGPKKEYRAKTVICNFDPKEAARMIGEEKFSSKLRRQLSYDYSPSSFVLYGVVKDINLQNFGFGDWNIWHCEPDANEVFDRMYYQHDYSRPYFGMNCRSLHTDDQSHCRREGCQFFEILTAANYDYWKMLKMREPKAYNLKKKQVLDQLLDVVERDYVPDLRKHLVLKMTGSPTTNERYANAPQGSSYGVNLTPENFSFSQKMTSETSIKNFYFCSAVSGYPGFSGTIHTGISLYEQLTGDTV